MKIVIPGGSGQLGHLLARAFHASGHEVVVLARTPRPAPWRVVAWNPQSVGDWSRELEGADAVVNLAGRSVNCRYSVRNRREILDSRVDSTRTLGAALARTNRRPRVWLQAGTATIYAHRYDAPNDELTGILGGSEPAAPDTWKFSIDVARAWEHAFEAADVPGTRKVMMRTAMTMSPDPGGVFDVFRGLVRKGLGGKAGDGRQYVSWIHADDFVRAVEFLIANQQVTGPVNLAAPHPLPNAEFMRVLREVCGVRYGLPAARWMLEIGAFFMRTETELVLKSRRVIPSRLLQSGFTFRFPTWPEAAIDLHRRWLEPSRSPDQRLGESQSVSVAGSLAEPGPNTLSPA
ncbi:TIGR01777 family oxidoreductase [Fimbriiglobus ruber]|uniref:Cell division inhibitor n=1 Tax=Fimbriiglobus ruber TaxID=1908690 RepID=A0A225E3G7_9BACT|nr:TIGR01777 family oxidoreductase [Fimbriiglobus ruber]OWK43225.1 Cell division inhibitor [Fimbriiglobus ruber]